MILVYFYGCVDDAVNNRTNHQFTSVIVVNFVNSARVCWIIKRTTFNLYVCLNYSWNTTNLKGVVKNLNIKGSFFKI